MEPPPVPGRPPQVGRSNLEAWGQTVNRNSTPRTGCVGHGRQTTMPTGTTGIFSLTNWYLCRDEAPSRSGVARAASPRDLTARGHRVVGI